MTRDDAADRVARRFDHDEDDDDTDDVDDAGSSKEMNAMNAVSAGKEVENVKEAWSGKTVYLSDSLKSELGKTYKRLDLEFDDELTEFRKTRHLYPLIVQAGLERIERMERDEIMELLEGIDPDFKDYKTE